MDTKRQSFYSSSSIANFQEKLAKRTGLPRWSLAKLNDQTIFFGLYHWGDYLRLLLHRGPKRIFWCGSDITNLEQSRWKKTKVKIVKPHQNFCENSVEYRALKRLGIVAEIAPMIFDDPEPYKPPHKKADGFHVWASVRAGREEEYGYREMCTLAKKLPAVTFHLFGSDSLWSSAPANLIFESTVSEERFNFLIKHYHASIRFNTFDGFSEVTAKSILLGQYPFTKISYPRIDTFRSLKDLASRLDGLQKHYPGPNKNRQFWKNHLEWSFKKILA